MGEFKPRDRVLVNIYGILYPGTVVNVSDYREPSMKYAVDLDAYKDDLMFVPESALIKEDVGNA